MKKKRHVFACAFMAVAIVAAIPLGINRSLSKMREEAAGHYFYDQTGYALYEGIEKREEAANNLITVAKRYSDENGELNKLIDELEYRVRVCESSSYDYERNTFAEVVHANAQLDQPARQLASALEAVGLAEKDEKYPRQMLALMESEQDKLSRSSYNDEARKFNTKLDQLKPFAILKPMSTFEKVDQETAAQAMEGTAETAVTQNTGVPSPPDAPAPPAAPDLYSVVEQAQAFAEDTADRATDFADHVTDWADGLSDEITDRVTEALGG